MQKISFFPPRKCLNKTVEWLAFLTIPDSEKQNEQTKTNPENAIFKVWLIFKNIL